MGVVGKELMRLCYHYTGTTTIQIFCIVCKRSSIPEAPTMYMNTVSEPIVLHK